MKIELQTKDGELLGLLDGDPVLVTALTLNTGANGENPELRVTCVRNGKEHSMPDEVAIMEFADIQLIATGEHCTYQGFSLDEACDAGVFP